MVWLLKRVKSCTIYIIPYSSTTCCNWHTLAQKMVGRACGLPEGQVLVLTANLRWLQLVLKIQYDSWRVKRFSLLGLLCWLQSFCHTAAYPKPVDVQMHFQTSSWTVVVCLYVRVTPLLVKPYASSRYSRYWWCTRFPIGISFPAGSGLVALQLV